MFLRVPVLVLDGTLREVFGHLRILLDPYEKSCHSQDKNVTPIPKKVLAGTLRVVKICILSYGRKTNKGKGPVKEKRKYTHDVARTIRV